MRTKAALFFLGLLTACTSVPHNDADIPISSTGDLETIVIVGTNDIHGAITPQLLKTRETEGTPSTTYEAGGAAYLAAYMEILKNEFGSRLLWLDAGDEFQGTIESNSSKGAPMVQVFNAAGLRGAAVGNHEFDFSFNSSWKDPQDITGNLKIRMSEARYPYLTANTVEKKTRKMPDFPNTYPSYLYDVGRLKVGVIGLTTLQTAVTTFPEYVKHLRFTDLKEATLREAKKLREAGAELVVIDGHIGMKCSSGKAPTHHMFRKASDPQGECDPKEEMSQLLNSLPPGTVDAAVAGHTHQLVHHWEAGVPTIQAGASGRFINLIYLTYDLNTKKLLTDRTRIEGPVPICPKVFQNQGDCNGDRPAPKNGRGSLVTPKFHGVAIQANPTIEQMIKPVSEEGEKIRSEVISHAAHPIEHGRFDESPLGNLVADALRIAGEADFGVMNAGGVRASLEAGPVTYGAIFRSVPFDNLVTTLTVTGKELKDILRITESGSRGFFSVSGLQLRLIGPTFDAPADDLNQNGKIDPWEINRLLDVRDSTGNPIDDAKSYRLATLDFLVLGGDDLGWAMSKIPSKRIHSYPLSARDALIQHIRRLAAQHPEGADKFSLNTAENPLLNPKSPRLKFENPEKKKERKPRKTGRKSKKGKNK